MSDSERAPSADHDPQAPPTRVRGAHRPGSIPPAAIVRIVIIGLPVMVASWFILLWVREALGLDR